MSSRALINRVKTGLLAMSLVLFASFATAAQSAQIEAGSQIGFVGTANITGDDPGVGAGDLTITSGLALATTGSFVGAVPLGSATDFAAPISWASSGAITAPSTGSELWSISTLPLASFILGSGTASLTGAGLLEIVAQGTLTLVGFDDTPGTFVFNETGLTFSANAVAEVPLPAAVWLFGSALMGLVAVRRRAVK